MDVFLLVARLFLSALMAVAGLAKIADLNGSRAALSGFGVPTTLVVPASILLPLAELLAALLLLTEAGARWGAVLTAGLLALFVVSIAYNLRRGRQPDCHCFGQLHSAPISSRTLLRNGAFLSIALFVVAAGWSDPGASLFTSLAVLSVFQLFTVVGGVLLLLLAIGHAWFTLHLFRQHGRVLLRLDELEARLVTGAGAAVAQPIKTPSFALPALSGEMIHLEQLLGASKPLLLLFSDPKCAPCKALLPEVRRWQRGMAERLTIAIISRGTQQENRVLSGRHGLSLVLLQEDSEVAQAYGVNGTPAAILVNTGGTLARGPVYGAEEIRQLVERYPQHLSALPLPAAIMQPSSGTYNGGCNCGGNGNGHKDRNSRQNHSPDVAKVGEEAPGVRLPDLKGQLIDLADFRGRSTLLLFWNPACGFCAQMLEELRAWEAAEKDDGPSLLVVSAGSQEANNAMGLRSKVVLDEGFNAGRTFGATGTPSAILVDARGMIASRVAVGAAQIWTLLRGEEIQPLSQAEGGER